MFSIEDNSARFIQIYETVVAVDDVSFVRPQGDKVMVHLKSGGDIEFETDDAVGLVDTIRKILNKEEDES